MFGRGEEAAVTQLCLERHHLLRQAADRRLRAVTLVLELRHLRRQRALLRHQARVLVDHSAAAVLTLNVPRLRGGKLGLELGRAAGLAAQLELHRRQLLERRLDLRRLLAYIVMAYTVIAYIVMALYSYGYTVMAYIVMACADCSLI